MPVYCRFTTSTLCYVVEPVLLFQFMIQFIILRCFAIFEWFPPKQYLPHYFNTLKKCGRGGEGGGVTLKREVEGGRDGGSKS